jgi:hypothetical protein
MWPGVLFGLCLVVGALHSGAGRTTAGPSASLGMTDLFGASMREQGTEMPSGLVLADAEDFLEEVAFVGGAGVVAGLFGAGAIEEGGVEAVGWW